MRDKVKTEKCFRLLRYLLLLAAMIMIYAGVRTGEVMTVFQKASYICLECIGIG